MASLKGNPQTKHDLHPTNLYNTELTLFWAPVATRSGKPVRSAPAATKAAVLVCMKVMTKSIGRLCYLEPLDRLTHMLLGMCD